MPGYPTIADSLGLASATIVASFFIYYLVKELQIVRLYRRHGGFDGDARYFTLRRVIRFLCLLWALLEIPFYVSNIWNDQATTFNTELDVWTYAGHLFSQAAIYGAFCGFTVLWLVILQFTQRTIKCAAYLTISFSVGYLIFTLFLAIEVITSTAELSEQPLYLYDFIVIPVTLMSVSFLFLGYGAYLQIMLHSWYKNNIGWQRHVLIKLNSIVCTVTLACMLRATMVILLRIEMETSDWQFFTGDGDTHPVVWTLLAQVFPNCTLASVLFYMSRPSNQSDPNVSASSRMQVQEQLVQSPHPDDAMEYYVAQSPSYSQSYFLSNDLVDDEDSTTAFRGGRSLRAIEVESHPHSLPGSFVPITPSDFSRGKRVPSDYDKDAPALV